MKPTDSIDLGTSRDITVGQTIASTVLDKDVNVMQAEQAVQRSLSRFEMAMERLAQRTDVTSQSIQHTREMIAMPKRKFIEWEQVLMSWSRNVARKSKVVSQNALTEVQANPRPYVWAASIVGLLLGVAVLTSFDEETEEELNGDF